MAHETMCLAVPGFADAVSRAADKLCPAAPGPVPVVHESSLNEVEDVHALVGAYLDELQSTLGWTFEEAEAEINFLALHAYVALNFVLQGRKAFWVDAELAGLLRETTLDISGEVLRLPFPACAFIFDDPDSLALASALVKTDPGTELADARLKVLTVYALELPPASASGGIRLVFCSDDLSGRWPHVATRDIPTADKRNLDEILDSHPSGTTSAFFHSAEIKALVHLAINAILYTTCSDFRFHERKPPGTHQSTRPISRKERRAQQRSGLSGETIFYLPGRIKIGSAQSTGASSSGVAEWKLSKRFWVRGHWRRPSPSWSDQRLRWIEPYLKGPEMTAVIEREYELKR